MPRPNINQQGMFAPPNDQLDLNMRLIDPAWNAIKEKVDSNSFTEIDLEKYFIKDEKTGRVFVDVNYLVTQLDFITRDIRLGNYDDSDLIQVRWYLGYAGVMASKNYARAFNYCIQQAAVYSETSQAKKGFLRKLLNTMFSEQKHTISEPGKKDFFTGKNKNGGD